MKKHAAKKISEKEVMKEISMWLGILPQVVWFLRINSGKIRTEFNHWIQLALAALNREGVTRVLLYEKQRE